MTQKPVAGVPVEQTQGVGLCWGAMSVQAGLKPAWAGSGNGDLFCTGMYNSCRTRSENQDEKCE